MALNTIDISRQFEPLTGTTSFPFTITYFETTDINVDVVDSVGVTTSLVKDAVSDGFTVTSVNGNPANGATITTTESYSIGDTVTIYREVPETQLNSFQRGGDLPADVLNVSLDRGVAISQQLSNASGRNLICPITDPDGLSYELPTVELRKNKAVGFDDDGNAAAIDLATTGTIAANTDAGISLVSNIISGKVDDDTLEFDSSGNFSVKTVDTDEIATDAITTAKIANANVTLAKIQSISAKRILGNFGPLPDEVSQIGVDYLTLSDSDTSMATSEVITNYVDALEAKYLPNVVYTIDGDKQYFTGATVIPNDDTIPQNTEGSEVMTLNFTAKYATSLLKIDVVTCCSASGSHTCAALFKDTTADAIAVSYINTAANYVETNSFSYITAAVDTSLHTFKIRVGSEGSTTTFNGDNNDSAKYGGTIASSIIITEIYQ